MKNECKLCPYQTKYKQALEVHMRARHSDERPFACKLCKYTGKYKQGLDVHMKTHSDERPYQCDQCSYASKYKQGLQVHMKGHERRGTDAQRKPRRSREYVGQPRVDNMVQNDMGEIKSKMTMNDPKRPPMGGVAAATITSSPSLFSNNNNSNNNNNNGQQSSLQHGISSTNNYSSYANYGMPSSSSSSSSSSVGVGPTIGQLDNSLTLSSIVGSSPHHQPQHQQLADLAMDGGGGTMDMRHHANMMTHGWFQN